MSYGRFDCKASPQIFFDGPCFGWGFHNNQRLRHGSVTVPCVCIPIGPYSPTHSSPTSGKGAACRAEPELAARHAAPTQGRRGAPVICVNYAQKICLGTDVPNHAVLG